VAQGVVWIGYTTKYREGGPLFARTAQTLANSKARSGDVICVPVERKQDFRDAMNALARNKRTIAQLHFVGHSGMYGPMFGTVDWPEQMSPHEWREQVIPFAKGGEAFFHCCRSARWFAPFFARTFGVPASGYHWYTTFSTRANRFAMPHK